MIIHGDCPEVLDTNMLRAIYQRMGEDGWSTRKVPFRVSSQGYKCEPGQSNARYLQVVWALEQIQEWKRALDTGMPMRQVAERQPLTPLRRKVDA